MTNGFAETLADLQRSGDRPERFSSVFLAVLPVNGATVATVGKPFGSETISATGQVAARLDELQFDLGEGPCWDALNSSGPVLEPDFLGRGATRWPNLVAAARDERIGSVFAFPMNVGTIRIGAVDLYTRNRFALDAIQQNHASVMADVIGRHVLRRALAADPDDNPATTPHTRRMIHQATGIVLAQAEVDAEDALLMIQSHAFTTGSSMMAVAEAVLSGELKFVRTGGRIEAQQ